MTVRVFAVLGVLAVAVAAASAAPRTESGFRSGFVLTADRSDTYSTPASDAALQRMARGGSDRVAIFTQWFLDGPTSSMLAPDPARTPTDAAVLHAAAVARRLGMAVTIKPQIGIRSGAWIGTAHPADIEVFWTRYRQMLLHYADLAERAGASMLVVGTEMRTLSADEARWRALIAAARTRFHGELTYGANYDEFARIRFWDALDYIGIDAYFPLADANQPAPSVAALASAWRARGYLGAIANVSRRTDRRVIFTEMGYRAIRSAAVQPNRWDARAPIDAAAQADAYLAFYRAVAGQPWMAGVYWWEVNPDRRSPQDYDPIGKPAESVVARENLRAMLPW